MDTEIFDYTKRDWKGIGGAFSHYQSIDHESYTTISLDKERGWINNQLVLEKEEGGGGINKWWQTTTLDDRRRDSRSYQEEGMDTQIYNIQEEGMEAHMDEL